MRKDQLFELVGENVEVILFDDSVKSGLLGYTLDFSEEYGWRKPDYFTIGDYDFKSSHVKKITKLPRKRGGR